MGALYKLGEFLLNTQVWTGNIQEQRLRKPEPTVDRSLDDPCPEAVFSTYHSSNLNNSEQEETHHIHSLSQFCQIIFYQLVESICFSYKKLDEILYTMSDVYAW